MWSVPSRFSDPSTATRMLGAAVEDAGAATGVRDNTELRRQYDLIAAALDGPADQLLVVEGAVDLGGVEVGDARSSARWMVRMDSASLPSRCCSSRT
jgi:hypothetical protein